MEKRCEDRGWYQDQAEELSELAIAQTSVERLDQRLRRPSPTSTTTGLCVRLELYSSASTSNKAG